MKNLILNLDNKLSDNLYLQIYEQIKNDISNSTLPEGTKLPSLRKLASGNGISVTTVQAAYEQLLVEGYIESRPKSGYYVAGNITHGISIAYDEDNVLLQGKQDIRTQEKPEIYDADSFDFTKWKKCMNRVFNECSHMLQNEADPQGEPSLRQEIARYLYQSRGVKCSANQIIIGAGSQQLAVQLSRIIKEAGIGSVATEKPGYGPIREILKAEGFPVIEIPMQENGISIENLPDKVKTLVYVNPSNQFPSGAVMPVGRRYELINWANKNNSYILEDDYDAEFRYRGKPIPAMQGLDAYGRVVYLGSFSSTLYASIKISYMVLPKKLIEIFESNKSLHRQTCSKAEQLCLAFYMESGYYYRHIKKLRRLYATKLALAMELLSGNPSIETIDSKSGVAFMLKIKSKKSVTDICHIGNALGLSMYPVYDLCEKDVQVVMFYFHRVPEMLLKLQIKQFISKAVG